MMVPRQWVGAAGASAGSATVDFADLDRGAQVRALERLVRAPESVRSLRFARPGALLEPGELAVEAAGRRLLQVARRNRRGVLGRMGAGSFRHAFARLFFGRSSQRLGRRAGGAGPLLREQGC